MLKGGGRGRCGVIRTMASSEALNTAPSIFYCRRSSLLTGDACTRHARTVCRATAAAPHSVAARLPLGFSALAADALQAGSAWAWPKHLKQNIVFHSFARSAKVKLHGWSTRAFNIHMVSKQPNSRVTHLLAHYRRSAIVKTCVASWRPLAQVQQLEPAGHPPRRADGVS